MRPRQVIATAAMQDIAELAEFIRIDNPEAGVRFLANSRAIVEWLATMPRAGSPLRTRLPRLAGLRRWPITGFPNHLIIYRAIEGGIEVRRLFHGASDWRRRLRRDSNRE